MTGKSDQTFGPLRQDSLLQSRTVYRCPGEASPVSEAVHRGRLASGWAGCHGCTWHPEHGEQTPHDNITPAQQAAVSRTAIRRTEFGVRGPYLNAIDRFRGAQLASIFSTHLASIHSDVARQRQIQNDAADSRQLIDVDSDITVAVGYDDRLGAPDVFSGVVSAVLQNGCHVIDAGRSTAASLLHTCQRYPHLSGSLLVTGSGGASGDIGLDVFDLHGQGVSIPWQKFGVSVRLPESTARISPAQSADAGAVNTAAAQALQLRLQHLRSVPESRPEQDTPFETQTESAVLQLPPLHRSPGAVFRSHRRSGILSAVPTEKYYQDWLLRWWPVQSRQSAKLIVHNRQTVARLEWLTQRCALNIEIHSPFDHRPASGAQRSASVDAVFHIEEDDRFLRVCSRRGRELTVDELAAWMNRCMPSSAAHLTAHASPCRRRILLVDIAAPNTGIQQQVISDGLAVAGWILRSMDNGNNPLPL